MCHLEETDLSRDFLLLCLVQLPIEPGCLLHGLDVLLVYNELLRLLLYPLLVPLNRYLKNVYAQSVGRAVWLRCVEIQ